MFGSIILSAALGLGFGKLGLWGPDQPFDPDNPINPWARRLVGIVGGIAGGLLVSQFLSESLDVVGLGAIAGGFVLGELASMMGKK